MATATATQTRRPATKTASQGSRRAVRGNSDARDAVLREAEHVKANGRVGVSEQVQEGVKMVDASELRHLLNDMPDKYLPCRSFGHGKALANYDDSHRGYVTYTLYCPGCKFRRDITQSKKTGEIISDKPDWPEGYLLPKGSGRIGADVKGIVRIATIERVVKGHSKVVTFGGKRAS